MKQKTPGKDIPYTTNVLFDEIKQLLIENEEWPENLLDYATPTRKQISIKDCEFDVKMDLYFGGNEGIYLLIYLEGYNGNKECLHDKYELGTFKTLNETKEAFQQMALLGANFIYACRSLIANHLEDFIWSGYKLTATDKNGNKK